jgi:hypothetical protein
MSSETDPQVHGPQLPPSDVIAVREKTRSPGGVPLSPPIPFTPETPFVIHLTREAADELNELMAQTGDTPTQLLRKALGLYKVTRQAIQEGKAVGIAETPDSLESQFVGI